MNELSKNLILSDLKHCKAMFSTMINAINEYVQEPESITDRALRNRIRNIKAELKYMSTEIEFYLNNVAMVDDQTLVNLTIELNNSTTQAHHALKIYKKYMQEGDF